MGSFYIDNISKRVADLLLAVVAIGILVVSVEYVKFAVDNPDEIGRIHFWQRLALMLLVVAFTSYNLLAYSSYFAENQVEKFSAGGSGPTDGAAENDAGVGQIIALFLLDLLQVMITAWLFAVLLIGNLTSAGGTLAASDSRSVAAPRKGTILALLGFLGLWHLTIVVWYAVRGESSADQKLHSVFFAAYLAATLVFTLLYVVFEGSNESQVLTWLAIGTVACGVVATYRVHGRRYVAGALQSSDSTSRP